MVKVERFEVEQWMDEYETTAKYNIAETCCASVSIEHLLSLSQAQGNPTPSALELFSPSTPQTYGEIRGTTSLRTNLANLYNSRTEHPIKPDNILITPGAIAANFLALYSLVGPGDHVVCQHPTYQQLYSVPRSLGAEISLWEMREENEWQLDIEELKAMIRPNTKLIVINNPNNPTGQVLPRPLLSSIITLASSHNPPITILSDEVYRPLFHSLNPTSPNFPPSILNIEPSYPHVIATGSLSKAYSLAGIRVGWLATRSPELLEACASARDYTNISVGIIDQNVAAFALSPACVHALLARNLGLAKTNLAILEKYVDKWVEKGWAWWVKPVAGTTAFIKFVRDGKAVDAVEMCKRLQNETGVMFLPGDRGFGDREGEGYQGFVRIGYVPETKVLEAGLKICDEWMGRSWEGLKLDE